LSPAAARPAASETDSLVDIDTISPNPYQPRDVFDDAAIEELAQSIQQKGILQPLLVRRVGEGLQLIAGERRLRAARRAGLARVPVLVRDVDDREALELAVIENVQRENLNPIEEARAYERLVDEFGLRHEEIAVRVSKSRSAVVNSLRLLQLPAEVMRQVESGEISAGHARALLALESPEAQAEAAREVLRAKLSVRETERLVRRHAARERDVDREALETALAHALGTKVRLRTTAGGKRGRIEIEFYSLEELDGLVERLAGSPRAAASF
jgi:ParB family chromosome partitioning protein